ncbi:MAG TPA: hypothetical protein VNX21_08905, partial [Candidatus Thermoplasmatota archaeon]|nr:hypothetical protein [Candidatus Thermoplasmatota archaeon]
VSSNMTPLARMSTAFGGRPAQLVVNLVVGRDLLAAALASPAGADPAPGMSLLLADVKDPASPRVLSVTPFAGGGVESVALTPDDRLAFVGTEFSNGGIWTVDVADPASPRVLAFTPVPTEGPHNVRYAEVEGRRLLLASVSHVQTALNVLGFPQDPLPVGPHLRVDVFEMTDPARPLTLLSSYAPGDDEGLDGPAIVHDAVLQRHPRTGQPLMYVANWDRGLRIVDLTDPAAPVEVGRFTDASPSGMLTIHTAKPMPAPIGDRHYAIATSQCAYSPDKECHLRVVDVTDPAAPTLAATWTLPESPHGTLYTTEIFDVDATRVVVPWRHGGTWTLDLSDPTRPRAVGWHFGQGAPREVATPGLAASPNANAVALRGDVAFVADIPTGIDVVRLG